MTCDVCGAGERKPQLIRYTLTLDDKLVVVDHVPAEVCDRCGEVTITPDVLERLQKTIWQDQTPYRVIGTAVYEFA
jgi:YgiT-type zinc finger domain-containing protein